MQANIKGNYRGVKITDGFRMGRGNFCSNIIVFLKLSTVYLHILGFGQSYQIIIQVLPVHLHLYWMKIVEKAPKMLKFFELFLRGSMPSDFPSRMGLSAPFLLEDDNAQNLACQSSNITTFSSSLLLLSSFSCIHFVPPTSCFVLILLQYS